MLVQTVLPKVLHQSLTIFATVHSTCWQRVQPFFLNEEKRLLADFTYYTDSLIFKIPGV
jgi:hypothetical protein